MSAGYLYVVMENNDKSRCAITTGSIEANDFQKQLRDKDEPLIILYYKHFQSIEAVKPIINNYVKSKTYVQDVFDKFTSVVPFLLIESVILGDSIFKEYAEIIEKGESLGLLYPQISTKKSEEMQNLMDDIDHESVSGNLDLLESIEKAVDNPQYVPNAVEINEIAASNGNVAALDNLGFLYSSGLHPDFKDDEKALKYYHKAIDHGFIESYISLTEYYYKNRKMDKWKEAWTDYMRAIKPLVKTDPHNIKRYNDGAARYVIDFLERQYKLEFQDTLEYLADHSDLIDEVKKLADELDSEHEYRARERVIIGMKSYDFLNKPGPGN